MFMIKKIISIKIVLLITVFVLLVSTVSAKDSDITIACIPFGGDAIETKEEADIYAGYFTSEFRNYGYKLVARTQALKDIVNEISYQQSGITESAIEYGKQVKADYVMRGVLSDVGGTLRLQVQVISIEKAELIASDTREVKNKKEINNYLVKDMVSIFDEQMSGKKSKYKMKSFTKLKMYIDKIIDESISFE